MNARSIGQREAYLHAQSETASSPYQHKNENDKATGLASKKRAHAADTTDLQIYKRRDGRGAHARRLLGDYTTATDAQAIKFSQPVDDEIELQQDSQGLSTKAGSGRLFRPMNTLDKQPRTANPSYGYRKAIQSSTRLTQSSLQLQQSRGDNVPCGTPLLGDGFSEEPAHDTKRRKLQNGTPKSVRSSAHIDLTSEDGSRNDPFSGQVVAHNGKALPSSKRSQSSNIEECQPFTNPELRKVDDYTAIKPARKPRKRTEGQRSSQESIQATPHDDASQPGHAASRQQSPLVVINSRQEERGSHGIPNRQSRRSIMQTSSVKLENGMQGQFPFRNPRSIEEDINTSNGMLVPRTRKRPSVEQIERRKQREYGKGPQLNIGQPDGASNSYIDLQASARARSPSLRSSFHRDDGNSSGALKQRASEKMNATSDNARPGVSLVGANSGSEDELAGASTVGSQIARSVSPEKSQARSLATTQHKRDLGRTSPSDLPEAPLYLSGLRQSRERIRERDRDASTDGDGTVRIALRNLYCRSCQMTNGNIELVWDQDSMSFLVSHDGVNQTIPRKAQLVSIGHNEVRQWIQANDSSLLAVYIKGSITENSSGGIVLEFATDSGRSTAFQYLQYITKDSLKWASYPESKMRNIVNTQKPALSTDYLNHKRLTMASHDVELQAMQNRKTDRDRKSRFETDEIIYNDHDTDTRRSALSRMQNTRPSNHVDRSGFQGMTIDSGTGSKYFPPRRSSRHSKPVMSRSPSPPPIERWTRTHKPERWSHSVVYPSHGARRVTVDFQDLERLDEGEFLNDNVISFALRQVEEKMTPEHRQDVHFFNSFFYTALTTKSGKKGFNYDAVKRWTKSIDIFNCRYIVVPINIDLHWFVAIICNLPSLRRKLGMDEDGDGSTPPDEPFGEQPKGGKSDNVEVGSGTMETTEAMEDLSLLDADGHSDIYEFGEDGIVKPDDDLTDPQNTPTNAIQQQTTSSGKRSRKRAAPAPKKYDPYAPIIVHLDSFGGGHTPESRNLKEYLSLEAFEKRSISVDAKDLQGMTAKGIPEQTNFCDCGVYLVGYIEEFAKDPERFITKVLRRELDKQRDFETFDASAKRAEIRETLLKLHKEQDEQRKASKAFKATKALKDEASNSIMQPSAKSNAVVTAAHTKDVMAPVAETGQEAFAQHHPDGQGPMLPVTTDATKDPDELETEVPSPLANIVFPSALDPRQEEHVVDPEDEMLDDVNPVEGGSTWVGTKHSINQPNDELRDQLARELEPGPNHLEIRLVPSIEDSQHDMSETPRDRCPSGRQVDTKPEEQFVSFDGTYDRPAEVKDSQETLPRGASVQWTGTRTTFD